MSGVWIEASIGDPDGYRIIRADRLNTLDVWPIEGEPELHELVGWTAEGSQLGIMQGSRAECYAALTKIMKATGGEL